MLQHKPRQKRRWKTARLYTDAGKKAFNRVKFTDAKRPLDVPILFDDKLVERSRRGSPWECVLANGIKLASEWNPALFPHPVLYVYVINRTVYIANRFDGVPTHAVRYQHDYGHMAETFDTITKQKFQKRFGNQGFRLHLRPVKKRGGDELPGARETRARVHGVRSEASRPRGALRRAINAGLVPERSPSIVPDAAPAQKVDA